MQRSRSRPRAARLRAWAGHARQVLGTRSFWILAAMFVGLALLHYLRPRIELTSIGFIERHTMERIVFLLPIALATFLYGQTGGLITLALAALVMLPRVAWLSPSPWDALLEVLTVGVVGYLVIWIIATQENEKRLRQDAVARLRTINAISASVTDSLDTTQILNKALDRALEATRSQTGCISLLDRTTRELTRAACRGVMAELAAEMERCPTSERLCTWVAQTARPHMIKDLMEERSETCKWFAQRGVRSLIATPLISRGRVMGVMALADPQPGHFTTEDMALLTSVGSAIGVAVENAYLCNNIRYYAQQVTRAQEDERARIARELHDDTIQSLIALSRQIEAYAQNHEKGPTPDPARLRELQQMTDEIIQGVRRFSRDLRPSTLDDLGLLPTLEGLANSLTEKDGIVTQLRVVGERRRLSPEMELVLFRIAQEALNNVKKHARATMATITVRLDEDEVALTVQDNGKGFVLIASVDELTVAGHLGLIGMRERARLLGGALNIQTQPGRGTKVTVTVPLPGQGPFGGSSTGRS